MDRGAIGDNQSELAKEESKDVVPTVSRIKAIKEWGEQLRRPDNGAAESK